MNGKTLIILGFEIVQNPNNSSQYGLAASFSHSDPLDRDILEIGSLGEITTLYNKIESFAGCSYQMVIENL